MDPIREAPACTNASGAADHDADGFSPSEGDCDDCSTLVNPAAFDFPENNRDEDCSGIADDGATPADDGLAIDSADPEHAACALGLCKHAEGNSWGLISAKYVLPNGLEAPIDPRHYGLLSDFGRNVKPREGSSMLALSSGSARDADDPGFESPFGDRIDIGPFSTTPEGFPMKAPACTKQGEQFPIANDPVALELVIKTPSNANALLFDFNFYTYEYPMFVCSQYNDFFVALLHPAPADAQHGNVSFDKAFNPVSVNNSLLEVCDGRVAGGKPFACPLGTDPLLGTGFDESEQDGPHAATGWLVTQAPIPSGEQIRIRFALWDAGDWALDSLVLIDHLTWQATSGQFAPSTTRIPGPK